MAGGYDLGTARGRIIIDNSDAIRASKQAGAAQDDFKRKARSSTSDLKAVSTGMLAVGVAAVAGFGFAVKTAADFEKGLSAVAAVSGATEGEIEKLRAKALQLGADTKFSAAEAVGAMEELSKAGISTTDILNGAADATVALAAAGEVDLSRAAEIAANAMNVFNLQAKELPHVADQIAGAANASAIGVDEFAQSLQQSGAAANLAGIGFEDLTTAIALMGNAGIKGSDAGTSLKTMLLNLNPTTKRQKDLMKDLGIVTEEAGNRFFDAQGNAKSFSEIAGVLGTALKGMTREQKLAKLETLFGSDAIRAAAVIADEGAAGFDKMANSIGKISAADVAAKRMDNLAGDIEQLKGSIETGLIQAGSGAQEALRGIVQSITQLVNGFSHLSPQTQKLVTQLLLFGGAGLIVAGGFIKIILALHRFAQAIAAARAAVTAFGIASKLAFLTNPVFLVIAAIVALGVALFVLFKKNETFRNAVLTAWNAILSAVKAVVAFFAGLPATLGNVFNIVANAIVTAWQRVVSFFQAVPAFFGRVVAAIGNFFAQLPNRILFIIGFIIGRWIQFQIKMVQFAVKLGIGVYNAIVNFLTKLPGRVASITASVISRFSAFVARIIAAAIRLGSQVLSAIVRFFSQLPGRVGTFTAAATARFVQLMGRLPGLAAQFASRVVSAIASGLAALPGVVSGAVGRAISAFQGMIGRAFAAAKSLASSLWNGFKSGLFGSPRTLIEYAMIGMNKGFGEELSKFERQQGDFAKVAGAFVGRDVMVRQGNVLGSGIGRPPITVNQTVAITGVEDAEGVRRALTTGPTLRPIVQAVRARGG